MKKIVVLMLVLLVTGSVYAAGVNVPSGLTGFWRFQDDAHKMQGTVGADLVSSSTQYNPLTWYMGPWTTIGTVAQPDLLTDRGVVQEVSNEWIQVDPRLHANGGSADYVNQYTIGIDYQQGTHGWNSLYQTSWGGRDGDGELFIAPGDNPDDDRTNSTIGIGDVGYSTMTFDASQWHRIIWSVDNGDADGVGGFFRVYVDGVLFLDGAGMGMDGRFSMYTDRVNMFADNDWEDQWGLVGQMAIWDHALTGSEITAMGSTTTPLVFTPEPATLSLLVIGGLAMLRRRGR